MLRTGGTHRLATSFVYCVQIINSYPTHNRIGARPDPAPIGAQEPGIIVCLINQRRAITASSSVGHDIVKIVFHHIVEMSLRLLRVQRKRVFGICRFCIYP